MSLLVSLLVSVFGSLFVFLGLTTWIFSSFGMKHWYDIPTPQRYVVGTGAVLGFLVAMAFIGGIGNFAGPIVGAVVITWLQVSLSDYSTAWQLYLGLFFVICIGAELLHRTTVASRC